MAASRQESTVWKYWGAWLWRKRREPLQWLRQVPSMPPSWAGQRRSVRWFFTFDLFFGNVYRFWVSHLFRISTLFSGLSLVPCPVWVFSTHLPSWMWLLSQVSSCGIVIGRHGPWLWNQCNHCSCPRKTMKIKTKCKYPLLGQQGHL